MHFPLNEFSRLYPFYLILLSVLVRMCTALDSISPSQPLRDGDTLISPDTTYQLGFFSFANPNRKYLGIWFNNLSPRTYVWVANRETPLSSAPATLNITLKANLVLVNATNHVFWSSNTSIRRTGQVPVALLLNSGNFVVRDAHDSSSENFLWQSFDHPGNTFLPGMKLGADLVTGVNRFLSAWKTDDDPARNEFSFGVDLRGYPQICVKDGNNFKYRVGSWNGVRFTGAYIQRPNPVFSYQFVMNENEVYYKYDVKNSSVFVLWFINPSGLVQMFKWNYETNDWMTIGTAPIDECESYGFCGAFSKCDSDSSPQCSCLDGFTPKSQNDTNAGCMPTSPLNCSVKDGFVMLKGIKLPDTSTSWYDKSIDLAECRRLCLTNCSCTAYASLDITGDGSGCLHWRSDLVDLRTLPENGQEIYVRLPATELGGSHNTTKARIIVGAVILSIILMLFLFYVSRRRIIQYDQKKTHGVQEVKYFLKVDGATGRRVQFESSLVLVTSNRKETLPFGGVKKKMDMPLFSLITISEATNDFSSNNKLGEGGFGPVYKGRLMDGQEIAVKRLSKSSGQGLKEFENEVKLIAKLQHRNLVKLLGCCIHEDEKMLIYEYMPNRSLDFFIFDETESKVLDWPRRLHIIDGIARGLNYLHQDSRLKIIHRDLKTSNILLDGNMNPKISDFGLARLFDIDQTEDHTNQVVGTYGYMSPEYAFNGVLSTKSDVFSYGVMVLEIVSGKKNRGFSHPGHDLNLLGHAYMLWNEGTPMELIDKECLKHSCGETQVVRCIKIGLLCVQQRPEDRPSMGSVVVMLSSENPLPDPKEPGFFLMKNPFPKPGTSENKDQGSSSANKASLSLLQPR